MLEYILEVPCCDQTALQYQNQLLGPNHVEKILSIVIEYNLIFEWKQHISDIDNQNELISYLQCNINTGNMMPSLTCFYICNSITVRRKYSIERMADDKKTIVSACPYLDKCNRALDSMKSKFSLMAGMINLIYDDILLRIQYFCMIQIHIKYNVTLFITFSAISWALRAPR